MQDSNQSPQSAFAEVLKHWRSSCLEQPRNHETLRVDARTFFQYLVKSTQVVTDTNVVLATRSSHEEALAKLIQELAPAFTSEQHVQRICALYILDGALEGCQATQLSNSVTNLLGSFLLTHCGPIEEDDSGEDYDEQIRDAAVIALSALVQLAAAAQTDADVREALRLRVTFAQQGVEYRCALPEMEEDPAYDHGFGSGKSSQDIRGGLSALPRSKRALCFDLVRSAINGVAKITSQRSPLQESLPDIQPPLVTFGTFAANWMHGESDPRCLLQLLQMLNALQVAFEPLFVTVKTASCVFPTSEVFDAVAPYYPIQFTPPPNNIHGITRSGLHSALISVLTFVGMDAAAQSHNRHTMLNLSAGLFLEQLLPVDMDDKASEREQRDAVDSLSALLLPAEGTSRCDRLEANTVRSLSMALITVHDESSLAVAQGGDLGNQNKLLADSCRTLVSKVAFQLEIASKKELWEIFVSEPLSKLASRMKASPVHGRTAIAYVACLAASGGPRTLRSSLTCIDALVDAVSGKLQDVDNAAAAAHGIGAFFSSCRVAMDRAKKEGVALSPHPLEPYTSKSFEVLDKLFNELEGGMDVDGSSSLLVRIGAVRALESVLLASSADQFQPDDSNKICKIVGKLLEEVTSGSQSTMDGGDEWKKACGLTLGSLLGFSLNSAEDTAMDDSPDTSSSTTASVLATNTIVSFMQTTAYPWLLESVTQKLDTTESARHDRAALALACKCGRTVAKAVITSLLQSLNSSLQRDQLDETSLLHAEALSVTLRTGGDLAIQAYHEVQISEEIIEKLASLETPLESQGDLNAMASIANLALPATMEERNALRIAIAAAYRIIIYLLPAYQKFVPATQAKNMLKKVSDILPPLSDADNVRLCVRLPLLSAALHGNVLHSLKSEDSVETKVMMSDLLSGMAPALAEYVLSPDNEAKARSSAASCMHATITSNDARDQACPAKAIVKDVINPALASAVEKCSKSPDASSVATVKDCLNLLALVGSGAACRGGKSGSTADKIALFLVEIACDGKASLPFSRDGEGLVDLAKKDLENVSTSLKIAAASAYGSMLSVEGGTPLMKQRLTHVTLKYIRSTYEEERAQVARGLDVSAPRLGLLVVVCHAVCCIDVSKMEKPMLHQIATIAVEGLSSWIFSADDVDVKRAAGFGAVKKLVLASILKLICVAPSSIAGKLTVVTGLLRAYASSDPSSEVSLKLFALQALEGMADIEGSKQFSTTIKPAVVAILAAAMNHPSGLLRQAAVDVRNAWFVMD